MISWQYQQVLLALGLSEDDLFLPVDTSRAQVRGDNKYLVTVFKLLPLFQKKSGG